LFFAQRDLADFGAHYQKIGTCSLMKTRISSLGYTVPNEHDFSRKNRLFLVEIGMMKTRLTWCGGVAWDACSDSGHTITLDGSPAIGGMDRGSRPMELVLKGLCGCSAMDVMSILNKQRQTVESAMITAEAERANAIPAVFSKIHLTFAFEGETLKAKALQRAVELSVNKYCSVSKMLSPTVEITYAVQLNSDSLE